MFKVGFQFDLMVLGFVLLVSLVALSVSLLAGRRAMSYCDFLLEKYFTFILVSTFLISTTDTIWFSETSDKLNSRFNFNYFFNHIKFDIQFFILIFLTYYFIRSAILKIKSLLRREEFEPHFSSLVFLFILSGICARGSFDQHHLDLRHSNVTQFVFINTAIIPSLYAADQALRGRR